MIFLAESPPKPLNGVEMKPTLLRDWAGQNTNGWLVSEKLDGWRLLWDGKQYLTRQGYVMDCPASWYVGMPSTPLDGELFAGRGEFNSIQGRIRDGFVGLSFHVFDAPSDKPFVDRAKDVLALDLPAHCHKVFQGVCDGTQGVFDAAAEIVANGGEGVVVRNPRAKYEAGRTWDVLRWVPQDPELNRKKLTARH